MYKKNIKYKITIRRLETKAKKEQTGGKEEQKATFCGWHSSVLGLLEDNGDRLVEISYLDKFTFRNVFTRVRLEMFLHVYFKFPTH